MSFMLTLNEFCILQIAYCLWVFIDDIKHVFVYWATKATFKVREFESLFYKINIFLQKTTICIGLQVEQIFSVNM